MPATFYQLRLPSGEIVGGPIHGSGGLVGEGPHNWRRIEVAIERAEDGRPTGLYEPRPGHARVYPNYTAGDAGESIDVDLRGAELVASSAADLVRKGI